MDRVFSDPSNSKFDVRKLSDVNPPSKSGTDYQQQQSIHSLHKYNEEDYECKSIFINFMSETEIKVLSSKRAAHRKTTYPQPYVPIKSHKSMNKQTSKDSQKGSGTPTSPVSNSDSEGVGGNFSSYADYTSRDVSEEIDDEDPQLSERIAVHQDDVNFYFIFISLFRVVIKKNLSNFLRSRRRKFYSTRENLSEIVKKVKMIELDDESNSIWHLDNLFTQSNIRESLDIPFHFRRQLYYKTRKASFQEYHPENDSDVDTKKISTQPEDVNLEQADLDDLNSHRSEDPAGLRRGKISGSAKAKIEGEQYLKNIVGVNKRSAIDRSPHEVFVQLDELHGVGEEREWKETARWIKYEEDVEEGADRWGAPHVASLSFHSLLNLRRCLETGVVLMDLDEKDLPGVAYRVVEQVRDKITVTN